MLLGMLKHHYVTKTSYGDLIPEAFRLGSRAIGKHLQCGRDRFSSEEASQSTSLMLLYTWNAFIRKCKACLYLSYFDSMQQGVLAGRHLLVNNDVLHGIWVCSA